MDRTMRTSKILITAFLILCLIPAILMFFVPAKAGANEILSPKPKMGVDVLEQTGDYVADHFAFRQELITLWAKLNAVLFHSSVQDDVLLGENGWLYYTATIGDYTGEHLSDEDLDEIALHLKNLQAEAEAAGARFVFTVAPNKNSIYTSHMPALYACGHETASINRLRPVLEKYGINYVDLFDLYQDGDGLYYKTDSHWTAQGAAAAADRLIGTDYSSKGFTTGSPRVGDLYEMLYPKGKGVEPEVLFTGSLDYQVEGNAKNGEAITIRTKSDAENGRLLCFRDSFGISLYPYLAAGFEEATFTRSTDFSFEEYHPEDYDVIILEIVERNLSYLLEN